MTHKEKIDFMPFPQRLDELLMLRNLVATVEKGYQSSRPDLPTTKCPCARFLRFYCYQPKLPFSLVPQGYLPW